MATTYPLTRGLYTLGIPNSRQVNRYAIEKLFIAGLALRVTWSRLEPRPGEFDWSLIDLNVKACAAAGKVFSLSVAAGISTPLWVYATYGAVPFPTVINGAVQNIPVPWDEKYIGRLAKLIVALSDRYGKNPILTHVKITGICKHSSETMLPFGDTDNEHWQAIGYTRPLLRRTWCRIADLWAGAFGGKCISYQHVAHAWPPIDDKGQIVPGLKDDWHLNEQLIGDGIRRYKDQFMAENHGLSSVWASEQIVKVSTRTRTGHQMNWNTVDDKEGKMTGGAPSPYDRAAVMKAAIDRGLAAGAKWLEVYQVDVNTLDLQPIFEDAAKRLAV